MTEQEEEIQNDESIVIELPDYYLAELKEAFLLFDEEETNMIKTSNLFELMRILGTPADVDDHRLLLHKYDPDETGFIDFKSCEEIMSDKLKDIEPYDELKNAFLQFDNSGYIDEKELCTIMSTLGNPLNKIELKKFMKQFEANKDGCLYWDDYVQLLNPNKIEI